MIRDATATRAALDAVRDAPTLLAALHAAPALAAAARQDGPHAAPLLAAALADGADQLTAIAAVHAAAVADRAVAAELVVPLLTSRVGHLREHAAWALGAAPIVRQAVPLLTRLAEAGEFTGTLAEATLEAWGVQPATAAGAGAAPGQGRRPRRPGEGLTVAQLFLHADIDGRLLHAGEGDTGGVATLLVHLGDALLREDGIERVLTLSRGGDAAGAALAAPGHHYLPVPLPGPVLHMRDAWPLRAAARREIRRLLAEGGADLVHLRMADVGSWAAAQAAADLGLPTVVTVAPDPHALIAARDAAGTLTRATFGAADLVEHLYFRVRLLADLAAGAAHLVVFPRPRLADDLRDLLGLDPERPGRPISVVPEGIELAPHALADREVAAAAAGVPASRATAASLADLDAVLAALPPERRGLPLAITVGRLHRVKGMATLAGAWTDRLADRCNLLVVGGDLASPSDDEAEQLDRIDAVVPRADGPGRGLLLAGHRPNPEVVAWLAAVRHGRPGLCAPGGVYVSASLKEEFGIAILEAMASGLVVVAPLAGGPATYVEDGVTGVLVDTTDPEALAAAVASALDLAGAPGAEGRAAKAQALVAERFSITTMASALAAIYREVARDPAGHQS
nr:glycosyltransferase [Propionibacterium sp.]